MIIDDKILIKINNRYVKYYKNKGYNIKGGDEVLVNVNDLPDNSHYVVNVICDNCGKKVSIKYYNYILNINKNDIYSCNNCKHQSIINTNLNKYGVKSTLELDEIKEKSRKTMIDKYGVDHYSKSEEFKNLTLNKYGVKSTLELEEVKEKSRKTMIDKYSVDHYSKTEEFKSKIKEKCLEKYNVEHYSKTYGFKEKIRTKTLRNLIKRYDRKLNIVNYKSDLIEIICDKNHKYKIHRHILKNRIKYNTEICTICNPINSYSNSGYETQLQNFIKNNYSKDILTNDRKILFGKELDIYLPDLNLAFEFNGLYWHNELNKSKNYHLDKTQEIEKNNIHLVHIYEDNWIYKQDIVKSMILNKLGKTPNKIYARKTEIKEVDDNKLIREFLDNNHIQGFVGSKIKLGLFYNNELVSLMTFGKRRVSMGKKITNNNEYELLRFCNKLNTNVIGGTSKLFKYFINNYNPKEITTYADRSYSQGKMYKQLGFKFNSKTQPNYYYIIDGIRHHRFNFRKDKLIKEGFDSNKTEHEIMLDRNIYRIYDSGNLKFIFNI